MTPREVREPGWRRGAVVAFKIAVWIALWAGVTQVSVDFAKAHVLRREEIDGYLAGVALLGVIQIGPAGLLLSLFLAKPRRTAWFWACAIAAGVMSSLLPFVLLSRLYEKLTA